MMKITTNVDDAHASTVVYNVSEEKSPPNSDSRVGLLTNKVIDSLIACLEDSASIKLKIIKLVLIMTVILLSQLF